MILAKSAYNPFDIFYFVEHLNLWFSYTNEIQENWYPKNINKPTVYCDMVNNIFIIIGHPVFFQATGCEKRTHLVVWIIQEKTSLCD